MLADIRELASEAAAAGLGLGAFNVVFLDHGEAEVAGAERAGRPVVLQISENAVKFHRGRLEPIGLAALSLARAAQVPVAVHLDHAESVDLCRQACELGFSSVMYDGSHLPYAENVATTSEVVRFCHAAGVAVEAELGEVGGKNGVHDPRARTSPDEAAAFVAATGVDLLAVAVGSSHTMTSRDAALDNNLIAQLKAACPVPLVLHGSSGVSDAGMVAAIKAGITKVNVSTHLNVQFTTEVRAQLAANPSFVDPRKYIKPADARIEDEVARLLALYAG